MTSLRHALDRRILFFGGKGGVGKTTLATARALESARSGTPTLLVSTDPAHSTSDALGCALGSDPTAVTRNLWALELDPGEEADRYMEGVRARIGEAAPPRLAGEVQRQLDIARASPGVEEAAMFDRFSRLVDQSPRDRIVFDTAPSGQTLRLLSLPDLMSGWVAALMSQRRRVNVLGRMWRTVAGDAAGKAGAGRDPLLEALEERHDRFERVRRILHDARQTAFVFVTLPERLPLLETDRIVGALRDHGIPVGGLVVNQVISAHSDSHSSRRAERQAACLREIEERFQDLPIGYLPILDAEPPGLDGLGSLLDRMRDTPGECHP